MLGLDPEDPTLRSRLTEYRQGLCLMRDLDGRVGEVQFDLVFPELLAALDTTPKAASA
jgi:AAA-like domain